MSKGEQLLFLNNDVEVINRDWLTAMLEYAQWPEVGAVGAKLLYTDGTIQHAGVVFIGTGMAHHAFRWAAKEVLGVPRLADLPRNCSAVTGACMMVPRRVFEEVGGFNEDLHVVLNDVDLVPADPGAQPRGRLHAARPAVSPRRREPRPAAPAAGRSALPETVAEPPHDRRSVLQPEPHGQARGLERKASQLRLRDARAARKRREL